MLATLGLLLTQLARPPLPSATSGQDYAVDTDGYLDLGSLVEGSDLIMLGQSDGSARVRAVIGDGSLADFEQQIAVGDVVKGSAAGEVTVIRLGANPDAEVPAEPYAHGEAAAGPVPAGDFLLFLQPGGAAGTWSVVGHVQGAMEIDVAGHVVSEFPQLNGLPASEALKLIATLDP